MNEAIYIKQAKRIYNDVWNYMEMETRTEEQNAQMLDMAHTSLWLWQQCGKPVEAARGEWLISRVYSTINMAAAAHLFANRSLDICLENNIEGIDLVFAYEAVARAYALMDDMEAAGEFRQMGIFAADTIADEDDRQYALNELATIDIA